MDTFDTFLVLLTGWFVVGGGAWTEDMILFLT